MPNDSLRALFERLQAIEKRLRTLETQEPSAYLSGSGAPGTTPTHIGAWYVDTTNDKWYRATDTTGSGDWKALN